MMQLIMSYTKLSLRVPSVVGHC